jgi:glutathione S-transferase
MQNGKLTIHGDEISQPVRSVLAFLKINKIPYEFKFINMGRGEHKSEINSKILKFGRVPTISFLNANGETLKIGESCAILRFLCHNYEVDEKWYPRKDLFRRAKIDQFLDWHHNNIRATFNALVFKIIFEPRFRAAGIKIGNIELPDPQPLAIKLLKFLDNIFLNQPYIVGNEISIADLIVAPETYQLSFLTDFDEYPHVKEYLKKINSLPEFNEINLRMERLRDELKKKHKPWKAKF